MTLIVVQKWLMPHPKPWVKVTAISRAARWSSSKHQVLKFPTFTYPPIVTIWEFVQRQAAMAGYEITSSSSVPDWHRLPPHRLQC